MEKNALHSYLRPKISHYLLEVFGLGDELLSDVNRLNALTKEFASRSSLKIMGQLQFEFKPSGITLMYVLSASHLVVHTWPEFNYLHMDLMKCDGLVDESLLSDNAANVFSTKQVIITPVTYASLTNLSDGHNNR